MSLFVVENVKRVYRLAGNVTKHGGASLLMPCWCSRQAKHTRAGPVAQSQLQSQPAVELLQKYGEKGVGWELCFLITCNLWVGSGRVETGLWCRPGGVDVGVRRGVCARVGRYFRTFLLEGGL